MTKIKPSESKCEDLLPVLVTLKKVKDIAKVMEVKVKDEQQDIRLYGDVLLSNQTDLTQYSTLFKLYAQVLRQYKLLRHQHKAFLLAKGRGHVILNHPQRESKSKEEVHRLHTLIQCDHETLQTVTKQLRNYKQQLDSQCHSNKEHSNNSLSNGSCNDLSLSNAVLSDKNDDESSSGKISEHRNNNCNSTKRAASGNLATGAATGNLATRVASGNLATRARRCNWKGKPSSRKPLLRTRDTLRTRKTGNLATEQQRSRTQQNSNNGNNSNDSSQHHNNKPLLTRLYSKLHQMTLQVHPQQHRFKKLPSNQKSSLINLSAYEKSSLKQLSKDKESFINIQASNQETSLKTHRGLLVAKGYLLLQQDGAMDTVVMVTRELEKRLVQLQVANEMVAYRRRSGKHETGRSLREKARSRWSMIMLNARFVLLKARSMWVLGRIQQLRDKQTNLWREYMKLRQELRSHVREALEELQDQGIHSSVDADRKVSVNTVLIQTTELPRNHSNTKLKQLEKTMAGKKRKAEVLMRKAKCVCARINDKTRELDEINRRIEINRDSYYSNKPFKSAVEAWRRWTYLYGYRALGDQLLDNSLDAMFASPSNGNGVLSKQQEVTEEGNSGIPSHSKEKVTTSNVSVTTTIVSDDQVKKVPSNHCVAPTNHNGSHSNNSVISREQTSEANRQNSNQSEPLSNEKLNTKTHRVVFKNQIVVSSNQSGDPSNPSGDLSNHSFSTNKKRRCYYTESDPGYRFPSNQTSNQTTVPSNQTDDLSNRVSSSLVTSCYGNDMVTLSDGSDLSYIRRTRSRLKPILERNREILEKYRESSESEAGN